MCEGYDAFPRLFSRKGALPGQANGVWAVNSGGLGGACACECEKETRELLSAVCLYTYVCACMHVGVRIMACEWQWVSH